MAVYFFDTSALVKRYVSEPGSAWVCHLTDPKSANKIYITAITGVEMIAAIMRKLRDTKIPIVLADAKRAIADFRNDFSNQYEVFSIADSLVQKAMGLPEIHQLRAYDALQLAAALVISDQSTQQGIAGTGIPPLILIASDDELLDAARNEGLAVDDPRMHP